MTTYLEYHRLIIAALLSAILALIGLAGLVSDGKYFAKSKIVAIGPLE